MLIDFELVIEWARAHGCTCEDDPDVTALVLAPGVVLIDLAHEPRCRMLLARAAPTN